MRPFYAFSYCVCQSILRAVFHLSVKGRNNIPLSGPFIAVSNHVAFFDPVIIGAVLKREMAYLAKAELFDQFLIGRLIRKLHAIPVRRKGSDIASIKAGLHVLQTQGMPLLIFPEGTRIKTGTLGEPRRGMALIAARAQVPVLPIYIENSNHLGSCALFRKLLKVRMGRAIAYSEYKDYFEDRRGYLQFAQMVMSRIQQLKDHAYLS